MKIDLISMAYNEEVLIPFFLNHYRFIDTINLFVDTDTTDRTREIAEEHPNVVLRDFTFPRGMDDLIKRDFLNSTYQLIEADYVVLCDSDEFIFDYQNINGKKGYLFHRPL